MTAPIKAPFPAFGGKSRIAAVVWDAIGHEVDNAVEPFCFSAAWMLARPGGAGKVETVNDRNAYVANFWRAVRADPEAVATHADWPVVEADLHARHAWLVNSDAAAAALDRVREDPDAFDARVAGWWCWGACCWIGSGWCDEHAEAWAQRPHMGGDGRGNGLNRWDGEANNVDGDVSGVVRKRPRAHSGRSGWMPGVLTPQANLPHMDSGGGGVNGHDAAGTCAERRAFVLGWVLALADRMRPVRVCCGHWKRVCDSPSTTTRLGVTGVFLDPPYRVRLADGTANRTRHIYANDRLQDVNALCDEVEAWCLERGADPMMRIALCGLEGEYPALEAAGWRVHAWKSGGGYGNQRGAKSDNAARERVWFSPHCIDADRRGGLFA